MAIADPLRIHCGGDKASKNGLFSGLAINILFSIAPLFLGSKTPIFSGVPPYFWGLDPIFRGVPPYFWGLDPIFRGVPPKKEVSSTQRTPTAAFGDFLGLLGLFLDFWSIEK